MTPPDLDCYYRDDEAGIYVVCGDAREVVEKIPPGSVDLVLTDPPYYVGKANWDSKKTIYEHTEWIRGWFVPCRRFKNLVVITGQKSNPRYALVEPWDWLLFWYKPGAMARSPLGFCNCAPVPMWGTGDTTGLSTDVIRAPIIVGDYGGHETPKPLALFVGLIQVFPSAKTILDPFLGSGTTLVAAKKLGRRGIGIEINPDYCEIAARRLMATPAPLPFPEPEPVPEQLGLDL